jgi:hypothetical protein
LFYILSTAPRQLWGNMPLPSIPAPLSKPNAMHMHTQTDIHARTQTHPHTSIHTHMHSHTHMPHLWDPAANCSPESLLLPPLIGLSGIQAVTNALVSKGAMRRSECQLVSEKPGSLRNTQSWKCERHES